MPELGMVQLAIKAIEKQVILFVNYFVKGFLDCSKLVTIRTIKSHVQQMDLLKVF